MQQTEHAITAAAGVETTHTPGDVAENKFTPELIAARLAQFERWQKLLDQGNSSSGRSGRPWREWINDHEDES